MRPMLVIGALLLLAGVGGAVAADDSATRLVQRTADQMLDTLKARRAEIERDPALINQLVDRTLAPHFDFEMITRLTVGRAWRDATPAQQSALISAFRETLVRTYANALLKYSDEEIIYATAKPGTRTGTVVVPTEVRSSRGSAPIPIDYHLHEKDGAWKVYDVIIDNVSLLTNYRGQFTATIGRSGIDGLIRDLEAKNRGA